MRSETVRVMENRQLRKGDGSEQFPSACVVQPECFFPLRLKGSSYGVGEKLVGSTICRLLTRRMQTRLLKGKGLKSKKCKSRWGCASASWLMGLSVGASALCRRRGGCSGGTVLCHRMVVSTGCPAGTWLLEGRLDGVWNLALPLGLSPFLEPTPLFSVCSDSVSSKHCFTLSAVETL